MITHLQRRPVNDDIPNKKRNHTPAVVGVWFHTWYVMHPKGTKRAAIAALFALLEIF
jgi:hypothetical protein